MNPIPKHSIVIDLGLWVCILWHRDETRLMCEGAD